MSITLNALPVSACTQTELMVLSTLENIEKGLRKTWSHESAVLSLLQKYGHVENWVGPIEGAYFTLRTSRSTVMTSVRCKDPFPIPERRNGQRIGYSPKLYVDGIDSCVLDELNNRGPQAQFNDLAEEMSAFKEDSMMALNYAIVYGDGTDAPKHLDSADVVFQNSFNGPNLSTTFARGTGFGLLSILGDDTLRPEYLTLSGADEDCAFWRAGIYDADVFSELDPGDPDYGDGHLDFAKLVEWTHLRKTPNSRYVAICDQSTYLSIKMSVTRRLGAPLSGSPSVLSGSTVQLAPEFDMIQVGNIIFVEDLMWPANSIGVFDFNEIFFKPVPEYWMKNTGWQAAFNSPLQKYLWEMWMFSIHTKRRNAHLLVCNPIIDDFCACVNINNVTELGTAIGEAVGG